MERGAIFTIIGGFLIHLTLGTYFCFGNLNPYITSYIRDTSVDLRYKDSEWIFAAAAFGLAGSIFIGGLLRARFGPRIAVLCGSCMMSSGVALTYFSIQHSFAGVIITFGLMFGLGVGTAYAAPMDSAMMWIPDKKGLATGLILAGFGGSAFIFDYIQSWYINPDNLAPNSGKVDGEEYFTQKDLLGRVPNMFLILAACYVSLQFLGIVFLRLPKPEDTKGANEQDSNGQRDGRHGRCVSNIDELDAVDNYDPLIEDARMTQVGKQESVHWRNCWRTKEFWILWCILLFNCQGLIFFSTIWKTYGQTFIQDDRFLSVVGSFASIFNAAGRISWGYFGDKVSFKTAMLCLCALFTVLMFTFTLTKVADGKPLFFIYVCLTFGTFSGNYSLIPTATARTFGQEYFIQIYGILFSSQMVISPVGSLLTSYLTDLIGWYGLFFLTAACSSCSFILMFFFNKKMPDGNDV
ncbi:uncharacterized protein LOC124271606 isoform X2 [Haliotis rubra]|uniref:uncharacterized protein LOC124271606 isoform X2 n=1 Tax=Haliotis rubra TaxID=36100 RepID=UPI001EE51677|nr:uncharacterized protein LOC124271606 isoform X2 [Haliotis rubra]